MKHTVSLTENYQFRQLYRRGKTAVDPYLAVYYRKNGRRENRMGITATKKIGGAVQRNRARRLIKEAYRLLEDELPLGLDLVVVARKKTVYTGLRTVMRSLQKALATGQPRA